MQSRRERGMPLSTWSAGWPGRVVVSCVSCGWGVLVEPLSDPVVRLGGGRALRFVYLGLFIYPTVASCRFHTPHIATTVSR